MELKSLKIKRSALKNLFNFLGVNLATKIPYELAVTKMATNKGLKQEQLVFNCKMPT